MPGRRRTDDPWVTRGRVVAGLLCVGAALAYGMLATDHSDLIFGVVLTFGGMLLGIDPSRVKALLPWAQQPAPPPPQPQPLADEDQPDPPPAPPV